MALKSGHRLLMAALWDNWSQQSEKYNKEELEEFGHISKMKFKMMMGVVVLGLFCFGLKQDKEARPMMIQWKATRGKLKWLCPELSDLMNIQFEEIIQLSSCYLKVL